MVGNEDKGIFLFCQPYFRIFCIRKSCPNKQNDAKHSNQDGCLLIIRKQGNSSNSLYFKEVYPSYRFLQNFIWYIARFSKESTNFVNKLRVV